MMRLFKGNEGRQLAWLSGYMIGSAVTTLIWGATTLIMQRFTP